jgi:hypothetical protein
MKDLQRKKSIKFDTFTDKFKGDGSILIRKISAYIHVLAAGLSHNKQNNDSRAKSKRIGCQI